MSSVPVVGKQKKKGHNLEIASVLMKGLGGSPQVALGFLGGFPGVSRGFPGGFPGDSQGFPRGITRGFLGVSQGGVSWVS